MLPSVDIKKKSDGTEELRASGTTVPYSDEVDDVCCKSRVLHVTSQLIAMHHFQEDETDDDTESEEDTEKKASSLIKDKPGFHVALSTIFYWFEPYHLSRVSRRWLSFLCCILKKGISILTAQCGYAPSTPSTGWVSPQPSMSISGDPLYRSIKLPSGLFSSYIA